LAVAFSPDGSTLAAGGSDDKVQFWTVVRDAKQEWTIKKQERVLAAPGAVTALAYGPDGKTLAVGVGLRTETARSMVNGKLLLHDLSGKKATREMNCRRPWTLAFNDDGSLLVGALFGFEAVVWETASGKHVAALRQDSGVLAATFAPHGRDLLVGTEEGA